MINSDTHPYLLQVNCTHMYNVSTLNGGRYKNDQFLSIVSNSSIVFVYPQFN